MPGGQRDSEVSADEPRASCDQDTHSLSARPITRNCLPSSFQASGVRR